MTSRTLMIGLALAWLVATCSWVGSTADDGKLAAVRLVITKLPEATRSAVLYVVIDDAPPSEDFVRRLTSADRTVHAATVSTHDFSRKAPRPRAANASITVWAAGFDQWAEHGAKVHAGYYRDDGTGAEFVLDLRRVAGTWRVAECGTFDPLSTGTAQHHPALMKPKSLGAVEPKGKARGSRYYASFNGCSLFPAPGLTRRERNLLGWRA